MTGWQLFPLVCVATLIFTRSALVDYWLHSEIIRLTAKWRDRMNKNIFVVGLRCPMCAGFWITLLIGIPTLTPPVECARAYLLTVAALALYDFTQRLNDLPDR